VHPFRGMSLSRSFPFGKLRVRISPGGSDDHPSGANPAHAGDPDAAKTAQDDLFPVLFIVDFC
jgi:hypothetical protein